MSNGNGTSLPVLVALTGVVVALVVGLFANDMLPRRKWGQPTVALPTFSRPAPAEAIPAAAPTTESAPAPANTTPTTSPTSG